MKKIYFIILVLFFGIQLKSYSQQEELLNTYAQQYYQEDILDKLGTASKGTYLKDYEMDINPGEKARYSMVLSKNTKYEFSFYEHETNQLQFNLYSNTGELKQESSNYVESLDSEKQSYDMNPHKINKLKSITQHEYIIPETGIYHMFVKNNTFISVKTVVLLSFLERTIPIKEEEITPTATKNKTTDKTKHQQGDPKEQYFFVVEEMPSFNGAKNIDKSKSEFLKFIKKEIKYPQEAIDKKIEGKIFVQFVIDKEGYIKEAKIVKGVHPALDQEALSVVYSSPRWQPGKQRGLAVKVVLTFPIEFKLP